MPLASLTALSIETTSLHYEQLFNLIHLTNLTSLSLPNEIRLFSDTPPAFSLAQLPSLNALKFGLRYAQFSVFFPPRFPYRCLKRLHLKQCNEQVSLPDSIGEVMPCLQELNIYFCRSITDLTDQFTSLTCVEKLTISMCSIVTLPENFGNFPALKTLVLHMLPLLLRLPDSFTGLASLETFFLLDCDGVHELPEGFGCLTGLKTLNLASCSAMDLPEDLGELTNLQTFRLEDNNDEELPFSFTQLVSLTRLELDRCLIRKLPGGMRGMTNLQEVYIQNCSRIKRLPEFVTALTSLQVLRIEDCSSLTTVPRRLHNLTRLRQLELTKCHQLNENLQTLPFSLQTLCYQTSPRVVPLPDMAMLSDLRDMRLGFVDAAGLLAIAAYLSRLERLELALGADGGKAEGFLFTLTSLSNLCSLEVMGACSLKTLLESDGSAWHGLRQLCIDDTLSGEFTRLPPAITTLQHLTSLWVHAPNLTSLPDDFGAFSSLRRLELSECSSLAHLPASLTELSCLTDVNFSGTLIPNTIGLRQHT
ncbi:unnamed protein product [Closterium sp. NIES-54]